jgi:hypothetical protein
MNLTDILPLNGDDLHKLVHHDNVPMKEHIKSRVARLRPFEAYLSKCFHECGTATGDPETEFKVSMVTICMIDIMIEEYSKRAPL